MGRRVFGSISKPVDRAGCFIVFSVDGVRRKRKVRSEAEGERKLAAIHEMVLSGRGLADVLRGVFGEVTGHGMTFREAAPLLLQYREPRVRASTFKADRYRLRTILRAPWTKKPLVAIQAKDLVQYVSKRMSGRSGVAGPTANRDITLVSALYRWAMKMGYADANPARIVDVEPERGRARTEWLRDDEIQELLAAADTRFRPVLLCLLHAGLRRGELMSLSWRSVDFDNRWLIVEPEYTKTGKERFVPLTAALETELARLRKPDRADDEAVFARPGGRMRHSEGSLRYWLAKTLRSCPAASSLHRKRVTLHVLRHTFASCLAQEGASFQDISYLMGHLTTHVTQRYAHMVRGAGRDSVDLLDHRLAGGTSSHVGEALVQYRALKSA